MMRIMLIVLLRSLREELLRIRTTLAVTQEAMQPNNAMRNKQQMLLILMIAMKT